MKVIKKKKKIKFLSLLINIKKDENYNTNNTIKTKNNQKTESLNNNSSENIKKEIKKKTTKNKNQMSKQMK